MQTRPRPLSDPGDHSTIDKAVHLFQGDKTPGFHRSREAGSALRFNVLQRLIFAKIAAYAGGEATTSDRQNDQISALGQLRIDLGADARLPQDYVLVVEGRQKMAPSLRR